MSMRIRLLCPWGDAPAGGEVDVIDRIGNHLVNRKKAVAIAAAIAEAAGSEAAPPALAPERLAGRKK